MSERIKIDADALFHLVTRLDNVRSELERSRSEFKDDGSIGNDDVGEALEAFNSNWGDKRKSLTEELGTAARALRHAVDTFVAADAALASKAGAAVGSATGTGNQ